MGVVLSLGSVNADFQVRVDRPPDGSGTRLAHDLLRTSGGKAANVAVLARRLGAEAWMLAAVGDDDLAEQALAGPRREGVDLQGVHRVAGPTGFAAIAVTPDGEKSIVLALNANDAWSDQAGAVSRLVSAAPEGSVLVVDLEAPVACVHAAIRSARSSGIPVVLDPAPPERMPDGLLDLVEHLTPDHEEAAALTGTAVTSDGGAVRAATELAGPARTAYVKLRSGGCVVCGPAGTWIVDSPEDADVGDKTGAGDAFAGALGWSLLEGLGALDAAVVAVAAATCAVGRYGSQESYPRRPQLEHMRRRVTTRRP
jgi:ribokinase